MKALDATIGRIYLGKFAKDSDSPLSDSVREELRNLKENTKLRIRSQLLSRGIINRTRLAERTFRKVRDVMDRSDTPNAIDTHVAKLISKYIVDSAVTSLQGYVNRRIETSKLDPNRYCLTRASTNGDRMTVTVGCGSYETSKEDLEHEFGIRSTYLRRRAGNFAKKWKAIKRVRSLNINIDSVPC